MDKEWNDFCSRETHQKNFFAHMVEILRKWYTRYCNQLLIMIVVTCVMNTKPVGSSGGDDDEDYDKNWYHEILD